MNGCVLTRAESGVQVTLRRRGGRWQVQGAMDCDG